MCQFAIFLKALKALQISGTIKLQALPESEWFCSKQCSNVHSTLEKLVGDGELKLPEAVLNILEKKGDGQGSEPSPNLDIRWRLLRGKDASEDTRQWLSGAVSIFHVSASWNCFALIIQYVLLWNLYSASLPHYLMYHFIDLICEKCNDYTLSKLFFPAQNDLLNLSCQVMPFSFSVVGNFS